MLIGIGGLALSARRASGGGAGPSAATWNPADKAANITLSGGNLTATTALASWVSVRATQGVSSGKYYWELVQVGTDTGPGYNMPGVALAAAGLNSFIGADASGWSYQFGLQRTWTGLVSAAYGPAPVFVDGTVIGVVLDMDGGTVRFLQNNVAGATPAYSGLSGTVYPAYACYSNASMTARFSAASWAYSPPAGYTNIP